jgi:hypothetical protein
MIISKKSLSRRTVLRGMGVSLALPLLDSMVPAMTAMRLTAANPVRRFGTVYVPNGIQMINWKPQTVGTDFELSPILSPMAPLRDKMVVVSGLTNKVADALPGEGAGDHSRGPASFLTCVHVRKTEGSDLQAGVSLDQLVARAYARETQLASLELSLESKELLGACDVGYSCAYQRTITWRDEKTPLPMENDPRAVFERMFGESDSTEAHVRASRLRQRRSILDSLTGNLVRFQQGLGAGDHQKMDQYLAAVRDIERRIQKSEEQSGRELPEVDRPDGVPATFAEHARLMFDLQLLAYQSDLTRVSTLMIAKEVSSRSYPEIGVPDPHHPISHHQNNPERISKVTKINTYHMSLFAEFLNKMKNTPDGDGSLLDHSLLLYGSGLSDGDLHNHIDMPILLAGGAAGQLKGGRHLAFSTDTPLANLYVALLDKLGVREERFGDSTGGLEPLTI